MDNHILYSNLFDYYGELLSTKQVQYFKSYYFDNLTLSEISENDNVSRNAVHKSLKETVDKLLYYESKLKLYEKSENIKKIITKIDDSNIKDAILKLI